MFFDALNWAAFFGWAAVAVKTALTWSEYGKPSATLMQLTLTCELISASEILRITLGLLRGDLALGITVHYTRILMWFVTLPHPEVSALIVKLILAAWSVTEIGRYPMVLFPNNAALKTFRYMVPLITFPLGAGTEAYAAYVVSQHETQPLKTMLLLVVLVNVIGGVVWYPSMIAKVGRSRTRPSGHISLAPKKH